MVSPESNNRPRPGANDDWAGRLQSVLADRRRLLGQLEAACERQGEVIASRDATTLLDLLAGRQRVVDEFVAGQAELLDLTASLEERLADVSADTADSLRRGVREISECLARVTARDDEAQALIRAVRDETQAELRRANTGAGARSAYAGNGITKGPRSAFADRKA